jgi:hypothetical protein
MAEHREELVFAMIRRDNLFDSRPNEPRRRVVLRDEWISPDGPAGLHVPDKNVAVVHGPPSVERFAGGEWAQSLFRCLQ